MLPYTFIYSPHLYSLATFYFGGTSQWALSNSPMDTVLSTLGSGNMTLGMDICSTITRFSIWVVLIEAILGRLSTSQFSTLGTLSTITLLNYNVNFLVFL